MSLNNFLRQAVLAGASDLHLISGQPPIIRVEGQLKRIKGDALTSKEVESIIFDVLDAKQKERLIDERDLDFSFEIKGLNRFRINAHWEKGSLGLAARVISDKIPSLEDLLMPQIVFDLMRKPQGLVMVTGPTGCGKSTTLAAMIELINGERSANIITLEDPIEYVFQSNKSIIRQRQLHSDMTSFTNGLKHILRQDPDVIMVGEMRDLETISATITLAETGHLVLATLHTYSAAQTVDRIIDIFPPYQQNQVRLQLSITLKGIVSQRLIPGVDSKRLATREILINTPAVSNLIRENKIAQIKTTIQTSAEDGMITMDQDLKELIKAGKITEEIAKANMLNPENY